MSPPSSDRDYPLIPQVCLRFHSSLTSSTMPLPCFAQAESDCFHPQQPNYIAPTQYSTQVPLMIQISPGIWSDGMRNIMAANHPDVRAFIAQARRSLKLPLPPSELVFVLAALEVFYKPGDPVHWLFWSDEKKLITAEVVTRISLHRPALIRSEVAWNGTPEYLSILANHHGSTWRQFFEDKDWYAMLVPPKSGVPKVLNLRKRKVAPGAMREPSKSPSLDEEQEEVPTPKRSRTVPAKTTEKRAAQSDCSPHSDMADIPPRIVSPRVSNETMPLDEITPLNTPQSIARPLPQDNPDEKEPRRQQRRRKQPAGKPPVEQSSDARGSSRSCSKDLADTTPTTSSDDANSLPSSMNTESADSVSSTSAHTRNRSTSHASAGTLVGSSHGRRSSSVLSTCTAVDGRTAAHEKGKDMKDKAVESAPCDSYESENKSEGDATTNEADDDESVGVVTRGRARGKTVEKPSKAPAVGRSKGIYQSTSARKRSKKSRT